MAKYRLMVSYNCGMSHTHETESNDLATFDSRCKELDNQILRWTIEEQDGKIVRVCAIHKQMARLFELLQNEQSP